MINQRLANGRFSRRLVGIGIGLLLLGAAPAGADSGAYERCLRQELERAGDGVTVGEIRQRCRSCLDRPPVGNSPMGDLSRTPLGGAEAPASGGQEAESADNAAIDHRMALERATRDNPFALTPHRPNYILPLAYNVTPNDAPFAGTSGTLDNTEIKFQISLKCQLADGLFNGKGDLLVAYTNLSFWQAYNKDASSPFRETNHEPEAWVQFDTDYPIGGLRNRLIRLGASHQSNGRSGSLSRSWNRLYADFVFQKDRYYLSIKPWWRIPEPEKSFPDDPRGDDNPGMERYLGYGELHAGFKRGDQNFNLMFRNNLRMSDNRGAVQLDWSFPLHRKLKGYLQLFSGYGESLIDYDAATQRIGVGILLGDWL